MKRPLHLVLALMGLQGFIDGFWYAHSWPEPLLGGLLITMLANFSIFVWYCRDSDARHYRRSLLRNIGINSLGIVGIPYYVVRSRAAGDKWWALLRFVGYCFLMLTAVATGQLLAMLVAIFF